jgi:hypothetical protein
MLLAPASRRDVVGGDADEIGAAVTVPRAALMHCAGGIVLCQRFRSSRRSQSNALRSRDPTASHAGFTAIVDALCSGARSMLFLKTSAMLAQKTLRRGIAGQVTPADCQVSNMAVPPIAGFFSIIFPVLVFIPVEILSVHAECISPRFWGELSPAVHAAPTPSLERSGSRISRLDSAMGLLSLKIDCSKASGEPA